MGEAEVARAGAPGLSAVAAIVRRHDPDRFFTALFAPPERREALFTLYAFNHELARAREAVREPHMALIRLQWWREVVEGARRRHEVAGPLGTLLDSGIVGPDALMALVDAREAEVDGIDNPAAFESYVRGTAGGLMVAAAQALGWAEAERLRDRGAAYGVVGILRNAAALESAGRHLLPAAWAGDSRGAMALARRWVGRAEPLPRPMLAAALPAVLVRRRLGGGSAPLRDRLTVLASYAAGRA